MNDLNASEVRALGQRVHPMAMEAAPPYAPVLNLVETWHLLCEERRLLAAIVGLSVAIALVAAFVMTPIYRAEVLLAPATHQRNDGLSGLMGQLGGLGSLVEGYVGNKDQTAESIATLQSRSLALDFIRQYNLKRYFFVDRWDEASQQWRADKKAPTDLEAFEVFDRRVRSIAVDRRSGLVTLAIEWEEPTLAASWANSLVQQVNERRRREAVREAKQGIDYLEAQAAKTSSVEVLQAIYRLIEAHTKTMAVANAREEYAFRVIDKAVPPERRVRPHRTMILVLGLVGGLVLAVTIIVARHGFRRRRISTQ